MLVLLFGLVLISFSVFAVLPQGLNWLQPFLLFLKGAIPIFASLIGVIAIFVGIADLQDKREAKQEELANKKDIEK